MNNNWYKPNFFIIGAPKSGTTSLSHYLGGHSRICMSEPKEPYFFNTDMNYQGIPNMDDYARCFSAAREHHLAIGEASTAYLYSQVALTKILEFNPAAKFIVMVRNPVDLVYSFHSELLWNGTENVASFIDAWRLQEEREIGQSIPRLCREPFWLQYRKVGFLGEQLEKVFQLIGRDRVHVIVMDDMKQNMPGVYANTLKFLEVPFDGRWEFPTLNESKTLRSRFLRYGIICAANLKRKLGLYIGHTGLIGCLQGINTKTHPRSPLPHTFRKELKAEFRQDVKLLSELLDRDLTSWVSGE